MSMQELSLGSTVALADGVRMPRLGLGVWQCPGHVATRAVVAALNAGYRSIDTARIYGNEGEVAKGIRDSGIPREEIFVTTKLWTADHGYDEALRAFDESEKRLGLGVVDQFLSHFPVAGRRVDAWRALIQLQKAGKCRSIGVSNYTERHLQELIDQTGVAPAVNQVEFHPYLNQKALLAYCKKHKIQVVAYSPLTHGKRLDDARLVGIADRLGKSPAQVLLRWGLQLDLVVIPKSSRPERIAENAAVFDFRLSDADLRFMDSWHENLRTCWDPTDEP